MVFDKNTQVCTITCLYNHVDYNLLRADIAIIYSWGSIIIIILFMKELIFKPLWNIVIKKWIFRSKLILYRNKY